jgi:hypothetical protein
MALSEKELEQIITGHLSQELTSNIDVPDIEAQWQKIKQSILNDNEIPKKLKNHQTRNKVIFSAAAILLSIGALNFLAPNNVNAFGGKITEFFNHIVGKTTQDKTETYRQPNDPSPPKVQNLGVNIEKEVTLEQAQTSIPYKLATPSYLPPGSETKRVVLTPIGADVYQVTMEYLINNQVVVLSQQNSANGTSRGSLYDTDDTTVKDITVNGNPAMLFMSKNGYNTLNWQDRGLVLEIRGILGEAEINKVANSVR